MPVKLAGEITMRARTLRKRRSSRDSPFFQRSMAIFSEDIFSKSQQVHILKACVIVMVLLSIWAGPRLFTRCPRGTTAIPKMHQIMDVPG